MTPTPEKALSREQIQTMRHRLLSVHELPPLNPEAIHALCDMALASLTAPGQADVPICDAHALTWFCERNHLRGGVEATCVVCAHMPAPAAPAQEVVGWAHSSVLKKTWRDGWFGVCYRKTSPEDVPLCAVPATQRLD